jgi:hypothetical protein
MNTKEFEGHTPGPWMYGDWKHNQNSGYAYREVLSQNQTSPNQRTWIADVPENGEEGTPNAHLIAAAPELLRQRNILYSGIIAIRKLAHKSNPDLIPAGPAFAAIFNQVIKCIAECEKETV